MYEMHQNFSVDNMRGVISHALAELNQEDMAFLFASGKSELEIRNQIALHLNRELKYPKMVTREWKRHDLVIFDNEKPILVIEGKAWIHADVVSPKKLKVGKTSILHALKADIKKMKETSAKHPRIRQYITIVLSTTDVLDPFAPDEAKRLIKYGSTHKRGLVKFKSLLELQDTANQEMSKLLDKYGNHMWLPIVSSQCNGMRVVADIFILEVKPKRK